MLAACLLLAQQTPEPQAFRAVFEDRPRQLIARMSGKPGDGVYAIFSPDTCSIRKIWKGSVQYRGKVYDFSQENSRAAGAVLFEVSSTLTENAFDPPGGDSKDPVWRFAKVGESIKSKPFAVGEWGPIYLAFEEQGDKGRFRATVQKPDGQAAIEFLSSNTVLGPTAWQWNYKQVPHALTDGVDGWTVTFTAHEMTAPKNLRRVRLFGDRLAWFDSSGKPAALRYGGYSFAKEGVRVFCQVGLTNLVLTLGKDEITYVLVGDQSLTLKQGRSGGLGRNLEPGSHLWTSEDITFTKAGTYRFKTSW
ncbi:MAG TPA: hypothetical protein PKA27_11200 [Fimbriimonadaceae bacterium]|nr:hypothetical protein [Fimbriimonadaceae bacterium]